MSLRISSKYFVGKLGQYLSLKESFLLNSAIRFSAFIELIYIRFRSLRNTLLYHSSALKGAIKMRTSFFRPGSHDNGFIDVSRCYIRNSGNIGTNLLRFEALQSEHVHWKASLW